MNFEKARTRLGAAVTLPVFPSMEPAMAESYSRIQSRIVQLQRQAESMRRAEMAGVVKKIKVAIDAYGLTAEDLFGGARAAPEAQQARRARPSGGADSRYADDSGNTWGGRGPRPRWLREAIAGGKSLDDFAVGKSPAPAQKAASAPAKKRAGKGIAIKYRDGDNTWTGRGSQPRWLRAALGDGKSLEQFQV